MNHIYNFSRIYFRTTAAIVIATAFTAQAVGQVRYTYSMDGSEVKDQVTKLIWRRCIEGMSWDGGSCVGAPQSFTHEQAMAPNSTGFRLPDIKELASLVDSRLRVPSIYTTAFPKTPPGYFWSKTVRAGDPASAWIVDFDDGMVIFFRRDARLNVRLVRSSTR